MENFKPVVAQVDETKLSLALSNLVENANSSTTRTRAGFMFQCGSQVFLYVKVEDSGIGIPEESQEHILNALPGRQIPFERDLWYGSWSAITRSAVLMQIGS